MKIKPSDRNNLPRSSYFPKPAPIRTYPIHDKIEARNALAQSHFLPPENKDALRRKISKKFPSIGKAHAMAQALKGY